MMSMCRSDAGTSFGSTCPPSAALEMKAVPGGGDGSAAAGMHSLQPQRMCGISRWTTLQTWCQGMGPLVSSLPISGLQQNV